MGLLVGCTWPPFYTAAYQIWCLINTSPDRGTTSTRTLFLYFVELEIVTIYGKGWTLWYSGGGYPFWPDRKLFSPFAEPEKNISLLASQNRSVRWQRQKFSIFIARIFFLTCTFQSQNIFAWLSGQDFFPKRGYPPLHIKWSPPPPPPPQVNRFATCHMYVVPHRLKTVHFTIQWKIGNTPFYEQGYNCLTS